jgi:hypothetical protein
VVHFDLVIPPSQGETSSKYTTTRGFVSFADDGTMLVSPAVDVGTLGLLGVPVGGRVKGRAFTAGQRRYLAFHRANIFLASEVDE